jgi:lysyl-tRNA synthetase class 2
MKRLLSAGYPRIFQICRCFRRHERGRRHVPEFTLLEWYTAGHGYRDMMHQTEALIRSVARIAGSGNRVSYRGVEISLNAPWHRISVSDAFDRFASTDMNTALSRSRFDEIMGIEIEPALPVDRPLFLYDYPTAHGALARGKPENPEVAERFELYMGGLELCNAFTELTEPAEQRRRFLMERQSRLDAGKIGYPLSEPFLKALERMPEAAGNALGVDRLVMLFADAADIDAVTAFTPEEL